MKIPTSYTNAPIVQMYVILSIRYVNDNHTSCFVEAAVAGCPVDDDADNDDDVALPLNALRLPLKDNVSIILEKYLAG